MLEIINGYILFYFLILCTLSTLVPYIVKPIAACLTRLSNEERAMWSELKKLKADQDKYSMKDEFASYSKIQRKIIKVKSQLKENSQNRMSHSFAVKGSVHVAVQAIVTLTILVSMFWFRHEPLILLKGNLFPFTSILQYPSDTPNAISTHIWVLVSNVSIRFLIKPLFLIKI